MRKLLPIVIAATFTAVSYAPTIASENGTKVERGSHDGTKVDRGSHDGKKAKRGSHDGANHDAMSAPDNVNEAEAKGKINTIDADAGVVNVTHEPVEALGWPTMTMDLPVTRRVDLTAVKPGTDVTFKLKKGRDKKFRIIAITPDE